MKLDLPPRKLDFAEFEGVANNRKALFLIGYIKYHDERMTPRRSYFARRFDLQARRFLRVRNRDFDYTD